MMYKNDLLKTIGLSCVLLLTLFITGCNDDDDNDSTEVTVTASRTEGIAPVTVSFDVQGIDDADINSISWDFGDGTGASTSYLSDSYDVSHTYTTTGTHTVTAIVYAWGGGVYTGLSRVIVIPDVNLVVSSFAIDPEFTPCDIETVSAIIQNIGVMDLAGAGDLHVGYYLSTDETITVDDIYIGDTTIIVGDYFLQSEVPFGFELLSPSENYQYVHQLSTKCNIPGGTYYAGAFVDYLDEYHWYTFPRATDTDEYVFPKPSVVWESNEDDNIRVLPAFAVTVPNDECFDDIYDIKGDDDSATATLILPGESQQHNFCFDNSDWLKFDAIQGRVYGISTKTDHQVVGGVNLSPTEADTQLILYDRDASSILLFEDNKRVFECTDIHTVDLESGWPVCDPDSEIVWEAEFSGTYFIKVRTTTCDEDEPFDPHCNGVSPEDLIISNTSPDGVGLNTDYTVTFEEF